MTTIIKIHLKLWITILTGMILTFFLGALITKKYTMGLSSKIWYKMNVYPSHSISFFIDRNSQFKIGLYDQKFRYSADRDLIYRLTKSSMLGKCAKKWNIWKICGWWYLIRLNYFKYTIMEEAKIREKTRKILYMYFAYQY